MSDTRTSSTLSKHHHVKMAFTAIIIAQIFAVLSMLAGLLPMKPDIMILALQLTVLAMMAWVMMEGFYK